MERKDWINLNGLWDYAITSDTDSDDDPEFAGKILVPFPVESPLSGVCKLLGFTERLWYHRTFGVPRSWRDRQIWLNFGALDWECEIWVNGMHLGNHQGGFDAFSFNITPALKPEGEQEIKIFVTDRVSASTQIVGKQKRVPQDTFYSRVSGIWQTVWIEPLSTVHISSIKVTPQVAEGGVEFEVNIDGDTTNAEVEIEISTNGIPLKSQRFDPTASASNSKSVARLFIAVPNAKLWSPEDPFLYDARVRLVIANKPVDEVATYFGMRKVSLGKDAEGRPQILVNEKPTFQLGILEEGYWPDGLYTAPTDEALRFDIETAKRLGFNTIRKHVKVEPERWYYWCDRLGMLVWQDMPNGQVGATADRPRNSKAAAEFELELKRMVEGRFNHPCIIGWVLFNQGWGQFHTVRLTRTLQELDPTRLVISASGWNDFGVGDVNSQHFYPLPDKLKGDSKRALFLGEYGCFGLRIPEHSWTEQSWSHFPVPNSELLPQEYEKAMRKVASFRKTEGLCGAIFTQLCDVQQEITGLLTYDRKEFKLDTNVIMKANQSVLTIQETNAR